MKRIFPLLAGLTLYLSLSGFQCASTKMNTAQLAIKSGDFEKAETSLEEELDLRPENAEAWYLLGKTRFELGKYGKMKAAFDKALEYGSSGENMLDDRSMADIQFKSYEAWSIVYDSARGLARESEYAQAGRLLDIAESIIPQNPAVMKLRGDMEQRQGNSDEAYEFYNQYVDEVGDDVRQGVDDGLKLGERRDDLLKDFQEPMAPYDPRRGSFADVFAPNGDKILAVYHNQSPRGAVVSGWKYYGRTEQPYLVYWLSSDPFVKSALQKFTNKEHDAAIELLSLAEKFDPANEDAPALLGQVYIGAGKYEEAEALLQERIKANPENPKLRINLGVLLHDQGEYEEAVKVLQEALTLDLEEGSQQHQKILYNLAADLKNWGIQMEQEASRGDASNDAVRATYEAKYTEALETFEELRSIKTEADYGLLAEIGNLHAILGNRAQLDELIKDFEGLESQFANDAMYWHLLSRLYNAIRADDKEAAARAKAEQLGG